MREQVPLLLDRIRAAIARDPEAPAFLGSSTISHGAMRSLIGAAIKMLDERGVRAGQVVALTMSQSSLHVILFLALARMGAISLSVAPMASAAARAALYRRFGVTAVVSEVEDAGAPGVMLIHMRGLGARGDEPHLESMQYEPVGSTPLRIALTSGTVGERKGIEQTHEEFVRRMDRRGYGDGALPRALPPNLHITLSLTLVCHALARGGAVVIPAGYDAASLFDAIGKFGVTHFAFPPAHAAMMLEALDGDKPAFRNVTHFDLVGGTPSPALVEAVRRKFTPHVYVSYATAETGLIAMATPEILASTTCAGRIAPGTELEVVGEDGRVLAAGMPGEIRVRVPAMPRGYLGGADPDRFRGGWFHPRDVGYVTEEGLVHVQGRIDEILNVGGRKASPGYVEAILEEHPSVREAAVFPLDGMSLGAIIVTKGRADWSGLDAFARSRLDVFAPWRYYEAAELPRNVLGKIRRPELAALAAGEATLRQPAK